MTASALDKIPVSILIPVKNDAVNLRECLRSVAFADEIVVVDSASADETAAVAGEAGARLVQFQWNGQFPRKKNWALENVSWRNEWILIIDADERITPALEAEIRHALHREGTDGFYLNRRFWFLGGWINHCGYFPSWNLRLFRHAKGRYERIGAGGLDSGDNEVHEHLLLDGRAEYLEAPMEHYAFADLATFVEKHNRYSSWEARVHGELHRSAGGDAMQSTPFGNELERKRWFKKVARYLPFRPWLRFVYHYGWKQGFRDGYRGWVLCRLLAWYEFLSIAKRREFETAIRSPTGRLG
jgi:glycosyltransferase involved in cell wall biosynthesis